MSHEEQLEIQKPGTAVRDPAHDIWRRRPEGLDAFFKAKKVAVIGATEKTGSVGRTLLWNLVSHSFGGTVFPVNPRRTSVLGIKAYPSIGSISEEIDFAVIATPASTVPALVGECAACGVKAICIISAGFKECGETGAELERQILEEARRGKMRIIGPNCLGVMSPITGLNATFASQMALPGTVGFISQSGALGTAVLDWSLKEKVGFSYFISIGSMLDVGWGDLIDYLGDDPYTQSILIYMETIGEARSFLSAAREVALTKPIIVIKPGRTEQAARAAISHTGSLTGSDEVLDAAFRRVGVLRVNTIAELFYMAEILAKQPRPEGPRLAIVTNAGGPGVLATDALIGAGGELAKLSNETIQSLNEILPPAWSHNNPVDILGDASPEKYAKTVEIISRDPATDGLLVILTPQAMTNPAGTAEAIKPYAKLDSKPILASWMGGAEVERGKEILNGAGIPTFPYPDTAARMFQYMWKYTENLRSLYETPTLPSFASGEGTAYQQCVDNILSKVRGDKRTLLTEAESKQLLACYGIPAVETYIATSEWEAVQLAKEVGYPVVLKVFSYTVTHKAETGGVHLNLSDDAAVRRAYRLIKSSVEEKLGMGHFQGVTVQPMVKGEGYELILGSSVDFQFGPILLFGAGGRFVEIFKDRSLGLPPLNTTLARRMMEQTKIFRVLIRSTLQMKRLEDLLVRFSELVSREKWIREIDINPLFVSPEKIVALDARIILHDSYLPESQLPRPAIRPYPTEYKESWQLKDGKQVTLRPIRPEDEPLMIQFHKTLSEDTIRQRYFQALKLNERTCHERLVRVCFNDYDREIALIAEYLDPRTREPQIIGVGRLSRIHGVNEAEFALVISDAFQKRGLGTKLLERLIEIARKESIECLRAEILAENLIMQRIAEKCGFRLLREQTRETVMAELDLKKEGEPK